MSTLTFCKESGPNVKFDSNGEPVKKLYVLGDETTLSLVTPVLGRKLQHIPIAGSLSLKRD